MVNFQNLYNNKKISIEFDLKDTNRDYIICYNDCFYILNLKKIKNKIIEKDIIKKYKNCDEFENLGCYFYN